MLSLFVQAHWRSAILCSCIGLASFLPGTALAQSFASRLLVSTATGFFADRQPQADGIYRELTWDKRVLVNLTPHIYAGIQHRNIYSYEASLYTADTRQRYDMVSVVGQYRRSLAPRVAAFGELVWSRGDYCTCGPINPYRLEAVQYGGIGFGADYALTERLALTGNFTLQTVLNYGDLPDRYGYNFYAIGVQYAVRNRE